MKNLSTAAISVLDLAKVADGKSLADTYTHSKHLAQHLEELGYKRFWLDKFIEATQADELIITSDTYHPEDRLRSYELIAQAKAM